MKPISLAFSLIRVPRLFVTLLLWPLLLGVVIGVGQMAFSSLYLQLADESAEEFGERINGENESIVWMRENLSSTEESLATLKVCRWEMVGGVETLPEGCVQRPLDVVIRTPEPARYDSKSYEEFFLGATPRLHICTSCTGMLVISQQQGELVSDAYSLAALGVMMIADATKSREVNRHYVEAKADFEQIDNLVGSIYLHPPGLGHPINISKTSKTMVLVLNTSFLILITLWLSLIGHRKVLQYFARNDALLPLVAACGKSEFYTAIWVITMFRVGAFLLASIPTSYFIYTHGVPPEILDLYFRGGAEFLLWLGAIITSLSSLTIIASIAELKHRHSLVSFAYKYIPIIFCLGGATLWSIAIFRPEDSWKVVQTTISSLPLLGLCPIIVGPIVRIEPVYLALHCCLASVLVVLTLRLNSRWFAAHLEEI